MRAFGIDISHWQDGFTYNGQIDFIIQKATEGWSWTDPRFEEFLPEVQKVPIRGAYHYFLTTLDPILQAVHFWKTVKDHGFHFLAVDYEKANNNLNKLGEANLNKFWVKLEEICDLPVLLYTSPYIYRDSLCAHNKAWEQRPLWMAHYNGQDPENGSPTVFGGSGWLLWQYTNTPVDKNVYNGSVQQMKAWLGLLKENGMNGSKKWYQSKTLWFTVLFALVNIAGLFGFADFTPDTQIAEYINLGAAVIYALLRAFTDRGLEL